MGGEGGGQKKRGGGGAGGVRVEGVRAGGPAQRGGIKAGDRIVACGDQSVWHAQQLWELISGLGTQRMPVALLVEREGTYHGVMLGGVPRGQRRGGGAEAGQ